MQGSPDPQGQQGSYLKFIAFCAILTGILVSSMVFGGYSSFVRAEERIAGAKTVLLESCRERLALLPALATLIGEKNLQSTPATMAQTLEKANALLQDVMQLKLPLDEQMTKEFETSQTALTMRIHESFTRLQEVTAQDGNKEMESLRQKFLKAQDNLFMANESYKEEVLYFNMRLKSFPVLYIAKLFGFHKTTYYPFSEQAFLPARKAFLP